MTPREFREATCFLTGGHPDQPYPQARRDTDELATEFGVPWEEISRARALGCKGSLEKAVQLAVAAKREGRPWRKNEVAIVVRDGKFVLDL